MEEVWVVVSGHYSDKSNQAVFATAEEAHTWAAAMSANEGKPYYREEDKEDENEFWIEMLVFNPPVPDEVRKITEEESEIDRIERARREAQERREKWERTRKQIQSDFWTVKPDDQTD